MIDAPVGRRLAVVQPRMRWTIEGNRLSMRWGIERAAREGAELCIFPELAVTGFHRRITELAWWGVVEPAVTELCALAALHGVALSFGAPSFGPGGARFNSQCYVDARGARVATVPKAGLTPSEATFFTPGRERPVAVLKGLRTTAVICREVEDHAH